MAYTTINLLTFLLGFVFLFNGYYQVRRGRESLVLFLMSTGIGVGLIVVAVFPDILNLIAAIFGFEQNVRLRTVLVLSNLTLFVVIGYLANRIGRLQKNISRLNEELSLLRTEVTEEDDE